jgi:antitoxin VapB
LAEHGADALVLTRIANFAWVTGGGRSFINIAAEGGAAWAVVTRDRFLVITSNIEAERLAQEELTGLDLDVEPFPWWSDAGPGGVLAGQLAAGSRLLADGGVSGATDVGRRIVAMRSTLVRAEQDRARVLGRDTGQALEAACRGLAPGDTEFAIVGRLADECYQRGMEPIVHLVAVDARVWRRRHPLPTGKALERYALVGLCTLRDGLVLSASRLVHFGDPDQDLLRRWKAAATVDAEMLAASRPGATAGAILGLAQAAYARTGFEDEWQHHHQGGLAGYASREWRAGPGGSEALVAGQLVAWNPSVAGAKSEDTALVGAEATEILTETGQWPLEAIPTATGALVRRPAILIR